MSVLKRFSLDQVEQVLSNSNTGGKIGSYINLLNGDFFVQQKTPGIALLSVSEPGESTIFETIRKELFDLFPSNKNWSIADAGHYIGETDQLAETLKELRELGFTLMVLSTSQTTTHYIYQSFCIAHETVNLSSIDEAPDLNDSDDILGEKNWLTHLISHTPNYLFNYSLIGCQQYLCNPDFLSVLNDFHFDIVRLGSIRDNIKLVEPYFRNSDIVSFDLASFKSQDTLGLMGAGSNGLNPEEGCRLMRYIGISNKVKVAALSGFFASDDYSRSANLSAQIVWHFCDGFFNRTPDGSVGNSDEYITYKVNTAVDGDELIFYKNMRNGKWWIHVSPIQKEHGKPKRRNLIPCNYEDYVQASNGEVPDVWWRHYMKTT
jgi:formiminoglutamase